MRRIDEFFSGMQFITASSTIDVGIDSLVHFPFIIGPQVLGPLAIELQHEGHQSVRSVSFS